MILFSLVRDLDCINVFILCFLEFYYNIIKVIKKEDIFVVRDVCVFKCGVFVIVLVNFKV